MGSVVVTKEAGAVVDYDDQAQALDDMIKDQAARMQGREPLIRSFAREGLIVGTCEDCRRCSDLSVASLIKQHGDRTLTELSEVIACARVSCGGRVEYQIVM